MRGIFFIIFIFSTCVNFQVGFGRKVQWEDEDTVIVEATKEEDSPNVVYERQDITQVSQVPVKILTRGHGHGPRSRADKRTCYSSLGDQGMCSSFKECFPQLYYTDSEHMGEIKHPVLYELLMSTSGPCDPLPFSFRDDFPGAWDAVEEDTSNLICCPNMKPQVTTKRPFLKKAATTTTTTTSRPTKPWEYVPDAMVGQMMSVKVIPPKTSDADSAYMIPMVSEFGKPSLITMATEVKIMPPVTQGTPTNHETIPSNEETFTSIQLSSDEAEQTTTETTVFADDAVEATTNPSAITVGPTDPVVEVETSTEPEPPKVMNAPCGLINSSRDPSQPWIAAIKLDSKYICAGSVVDNYHVLTSAHCIAHLSSLDVGRLRVYLGEKILNSNLDGPMVIRKVYRAMHHRRYDMDTLEHDIGLLKLNLPIPIRTNRVKPVCLPTEEKDFEGRDGSIAGWGPRWNDIQSDHLLESRFRVWSNQGCSVAYKHLAPAINITEDMMCAQLYYVKPKELSSQYDIDSIGSPLIVHNSEGTSMQVGIFSWRLRSSSTFPYVFTRVSSYPRWIQKNRLRK